ncbi:MAG: NAD(P)/FAD-dependent oxidoreductase, partial [Lachnospiraceae bacterium]|nr:NAD(P)/FAD-dependent oxidoreductase [Lachnospiraceae bacterium]
MLRITQVKLPCGSGTNEIEQKVRKILRLRREDSCEIELEKRSIDARKKPQLFDVYTVLVSGLKDEKKRAERLRDKNISVVSLPEYRFPYSATADQNAALEASVSGISQEASKPGIALEVSKSDIGKSQEASRPVVVGAGPAGLFCALMLAESGLKPILLERGRKVEDRIHDVEHFWKTGILDPESNVQFGEGGAGTFSDGKLNTLVGDKEGRGRYVLKRFVEAGAPESILYDAKPHIGTDRLREVVRNLREKILAAGGEIRFETCVEELVFEEKAGERHLTGLKIRKKSSNTSSKNEVYPQVGESNQAEKPYNTSSDDQAKSSIEPVAEESEILPADICVLAPGHSARGLFRALYAQGVPMEQKDFAVGVRVSHPQELIDHSQYGLSDPRKMEELGLSAASYKLTTRVEDRGVYTFCMCPGGYVVNASSEPGRLAVNGMSDYLRGSGRANSAVVMTVGAKDFGSEELLAGMEYQLRLEEKAFSLAGGKIPVEKYLDFEARTPVSEEGEKDFPADLCIRGQWAPAPLHELFPEETANRIAAGIRDFDRKIHGFAGEEAYVMGLESRTSSPVRILRSDSCESEVKGLFPCGEGAGYAGGIMSAAMDGIRVA